MTSTRVMVLGLDSCEPSLALRLAASGRMPNLASMLEQGARSEIEALPGLYVGGVWPSIFTGKSPAGHGRYSDRQLVVGTYTTRYFDPAQLAAEPFWQTLSRAGLRTAVIDVPHSSVSRGINGVHVVGWGGCSADQQFGTWPPSFASELEARFGTHPVGWNCGGPRDTPSDWVRFSDNLRKAVRLRREIAAWILERDDWDLFFYVFSEAHCVGHNCWHIHDPSHEAHDASFSANVGADPVEIVYAEIDTALGELLEQLDRETVCIVLLSHGMGPNHSGNHLLDEVLRRLDVDEQSIARHWRRWSPAASARRLPAPARRAASRVRDRLPSLSHANEEAKLATRRSFAVHNNTSGAIRVNLVGREPNGLVHGGEEYDEYCESLSAGLRELVNANTGEPAVRRVLRAGDVYEGEHLQQLPDLIVEWNDEFPIAALTSARTGRVGWESRDLRSGDHRPSGLLVATGPDVRRGGFPDTVAVADIAPTVAGLLGVELENVDGTRIPALSGSSRAT